MIIKKISRKWKVVIGGITAMLILGVFTAVFILHGSSASRDELTFSEISLIKDESKAILAGELNSSGKSYLGYSYRIEGDSLIVTIRSGLVTPIHPFGDFRIEIVDTKVSSIQEISIKSGKDISAVYAITRPELLINEQATIPILIEPPTLTISTLDSSIEALRGTTSWLYDNGDGTQSGIESDSMHPLDSNSKEYMPTLLITPTPNSSKNPLEAVLQFDVNPDEVSVHCWSDEHWGNTSAESEDILVNDFAIELKDSGYIYEVIAHWSSSEKYGGTAYYSFYAVPSDFAGQITPKK